MRVFYSELCLIGCGVESNVDSLVAHGAENIELMLDGEGWNDFHLNMDGLAATLKNKNVGYSVHVPVWDANLTSENAHLRNAVLESYKATIAFASRIEARHVVLHTGWCSDPHFSKEKGRMRARIALEELAEFNRSYGQLLLVENIGSNAASLFSEEQFVEFLDGFPANIGYVVDIGHAHINGWHIASLLKKLGDKLHALHIHDNDGQKDIHAPVGAPLGEGSIDWNMVLRAAKDTHRDLSLILEYNIGTGLDKLTQGKSFLENRLM
jgi:sugar phosphate isomerase/epimerase